MRTSLFSDYPLWRFRRVWHWPNRPPRCTPVTATHLMATATLTATATTATIIVTTPTILATTVIATGIGTKKNFGAASTGGHCFAQQLRQLGDICCDPSRSFQCSDAISSRNPRQQFADRTWRQQF